MSTTSDAAWTRPDDLALLACPDDHATPLARDVAADAPLRCPACGRGFTVVHGVASLLPRSLARALDDAESSAADGDAALALQATEARVRDEESARYDELYADDEYRHELASYARMLDPQASDVVLDVGAGTGRVVKEYAARCARVACVDISQRSLERLVSRPELAGLPVFAALADGSALPFAAASFHRAVALSVLCFLPDEALRARFVSELARVLVPGGTLVISTYQHALVKKVWAAFGRTEGALREGLQSGGRIWYRNETRDEFVATLEPRFTVHEVRGVCHRVPLLSNVSRGVSRRLDGLLGAVPWAAPIFATELVARCTVR